MVIPFPLWVSAIVSYPPPLSLQMSIISLIFTLIFYLSLSLHLTQITLFLFLLKISFFQDPQSTRLIGAGDLCNGLYVYRPNNVLALSVQPTANKDLWHRRLGHPSRLFIPQLFNTSHVISDCDVCARSKHTRLPFSSSANKSSFPFNRIFCDI